ncbi:hypothetical protein REPUB_Repub14bG0114000 [Reevesia pubescens]
MTGIKLWEENIHYGMVYQNHTWKQFELFWLIFRMSSLKGYLLLLEFHALSSRFMHYEAFIIIIIIMPDHDIPAESLVLPVFLTNDRLTLGCELWNEISHPSNGSMGPVDKGRSSVPALPSRIKRVFYMSRVGIHYMRSYLALGRSYFLGPILRYFC